MIEALHPDQYIVLLWDYYGNDSPNKAQWIGRADALIRVACENGADVWAGSNYPEGLAENTARAIADGVRGLVTAPVHPLRGNDTLDEWVYEAFSESARVWRGEAVHA